MKNFIPCYFFPAKVLLIDDNARYLRNVSLKLNRDVNYEIHTEPHRVLNYLTESYRPINLTNRCLYNLCDSREEDDSIDSIIGLSIENIYKAIFDNSRFNEISILLVDYAMPSINGLDFFKLIKEYPIKKVMVTGEADYGIAVEAFNEGIIDKFVLKDDSNFFETINNVITNLQIAYFQSLTETIMQNLGANGLTCLSDPSFILFFNKLIKDKNIVEYYLVNQQGSFLLLTVTGKPVWLVISTRQEIENYIDIVESNSDELSNILFELKSFKKIPFFLAEQDKHVPVSSWPPYMHQANLLKGRQDYYYSLIDYASIYDKHIEKYFTYKEYKALRY